MGWTGRWRNQYGSLVEITGEADGRIAGWFETALEDSGFHGVRAAVVGVHSGDCIAFSAAANGPKGDMVVTYTGLLREGKLETLWHYAGDRDPDGGKTPWWRALITSADTFTRD